MENLKQPNYKNENIKTKCIKCAKKQVFKVKEQPFRIRK